MRLFLIRHGETVDNVAGVLAGVTDSRLTWHGTVQAGMLAAHLAARFPSTPVRKIFTSDLQRAMLTGRAVQSVTRGGRGDDDDDEEEGGGGCRGRPVLRATSLLRERDFGVLEGVPARAARVAVDAVAEPQASMRARAHRFLAEMLLPELTRRDARADDVVVVVAHGLLLQPLYACLVERVPWGRLTVDRGVAPHPPLGFGPVLRPHWDNTAYLEAMLVLDPALAAPGCACGLRMHVLRVNCTVHIRELKRTRGGVGSAAHDDRQRTLHSYFGRRKA